MNQQLPTSLKQLNFKVSQDFYWKLKNTATIKRCKMAEVFERAWKFYEKREQIIQQINTYQQSIQSIERQMQSLQGNMSWEELILRTKNLNPTPFKNIGLVIAYEVLRETLEECLRLVKKIER